MTAQGIRLSEIPDRTIFRFSRLDTNCDYYKINKAFIVANSKMGKEDHYISCTPGLLDEFVKVIKSIELSGERL